MARDDFYSAYWSEFNSLYSLKRDLTEFDRVLDELEYRYRLDLSSPQEREDLRRALLERIKELNRENEKLG
jgi:hypothetical protein